jgi:hypothetical protein
LVGLIALLVETVIAVVSRWLGRVENGGNALRRLTTPMFLRDGWEES